MLGVQVRCSVILSILRSTFYSSALLCSVRGVVTLPLFSPAGKNRAALACHPTSWIVLDGLGTLPDLLMMMMPCLHLILISPGSWAGANHSFNYTCIQSTFIHSIHPSNSPHLGSILTLQTLQVLADDSLEGLLQRGHAEVVLLYAQVYAVLLHHPEHVCHGLHQPHSRCL